MDNEVRAQFRLETNQLNQDIAKARDVIQRGMSKGFQGGSPAGLATDPTGFVRQMVGRPMQSARERQRAVADAVLDQEKARQFRDRMKTDRANFMKDMTFLMMPMMNPGSIWATLFSTRQTFSAFTKTEAGKGLLGKMGMSGLGGASLATAGLVGAATALGVALKALTTTVRETISAYKNAAQLYSKSLMSGGLGIAFTARRSLLANIMGVSEREVFQFGNALNYLNPRLNFAVGILAKTAPNLTSVNWQFKILETDFKSLFATIADKLAPSIRQLTLVMDTLVRITTKFTQKHAKNLIEGIISALGVGPAALAFATKTFLKTGLIPDQGPAPQPLAFMKQLPASALERMGLVIGGNAYGGRQDYARRTAIATEKTANALQGNRKALNRIPRTFGMDPNVSNP